MDNNRLITLPHLLWELVNLEYLFLEHSYIKSISEHIEMLTKLKKLDLKNNLLRKLPISLWKLKNLESIKLAENPFNEDWKDVINLEVDYILDFCKKMSKKQNNTIIGE